MQPKYLIGNKNNIIGRKGMTFDAVVCVTKASLPFIYFVTYQ